MTTLRKICERSLRQIGAYGVGQEVSGEDLEVAMQALLDLCARLPEYGAGRKLLDEAVGVDTLAEPDTRYVAVQNLSITLPPLPLDAARVGVIAAQDAVTVKPGGRLLEGKMEDMSVNAAATWIYRADKGNWIRLDNLDANGESPYSDAYTRDLTLLLCRWIQDDFAPNMTPALAGSIDEAEARFRAAFARPKNGFAGLPHFIRSRGRYTYG